MDIAPTTIEEIRSVLDQLRQNPKTKRRFPQKLWDSIIRLTEIYPLKDVCQRLNISPIYLRRKILQSNENTLEFREIPFSAPFSSANVRIELVSKDGLNATIQGPITCLDSLYKLFRG